MTTSASASGSTERVIALRSPVAAALDPENLAKTDLSITPRLAALSVLSSRRSFWEVHALTVGFAMDSIGPDAHQVVQMLTSGESLSRWFSNDEFLRHLERENVETTRSGLVRAAELIEIGVDGIALHEAQFGTVMTEYCVRQCGDDIICLQRCLNS
jgi:hypothetical protein